MFLYVIGFAALTVLVGLLGSISIHVRWVGVMILFIIFLGLTGKRVTSRKENGKWEGGRYEGLFIDRRFKMSLSRLQITLWTILVLSAFAIIGLDRSIPVLEGKYPCSQSILGHESDTQSKEEENYQPLNVKFPEELVAALGISTASLAGASIIKSNRAGTKSHRTVRLLEDQKKLAVSHLSEAKRSLSNATNELSKIADELTKFKAVPESDQGYQKAQLEIERIEKERQPAAQKALKAAEDALRVAQEEMKVIEEADQSAQGDIHTNDNIGDADWSDMFRGGLVSNFRVVDMAKVQMFFFTIIVIFSYGVLLWGLLGDSDGLRLATIELPAFSTSLAGLLGISHAGYLVVKQTES